MKVNNMSRMAASYIPPTSCTPTRSTEPSSQAMAENASQKNSSENNLQWILPSLPNEITLKIFDFLSTPKDFIELMLVSRSFCAAMRGLLAANNTHARFIWSKAQEEWSAKEIEAVTNDANTLTNEEVKSRIENAIKNMQHVRIKINSMGYDEVDGNTIFRNIDLNRFLISLEEMESKQDIETLYFDVFMVHDIDALVSSFIRLIRSCQNLKTTKFLLMDSRFTSQHLLMLGPEINNTVSMFILNKEDLPLEEENIQGNLVRNFISNFTGKYLSELHLEKSDISAEGIMLLQGILPVSLRELSFNNNNIGDEGVKNLSLVLTEKNEGSYLYEKLQKLYLCHNEISHIGIQYILNILEKGIDNLTLSSNNIGNLGVNNLATAIPNFKKIKFIDVCDNNAQPIPEVGRRNKDGNSVRFVQYIEDSDE